VRKYALATAALIAMASPAVAADLGHPVYDAPVAPAWSWTGCYVGGNAGGLTGHQHWINQTPGGDFFGYSLGEHDQDSWVAGVQAGCDYQTAGGFVIGVAGNYAWTDAEGSNASARETGVFYHSDVEQLASATGRIGYAWDRVLGYVKGGTAWERDDYWATTLKLGPAYTASDTRSGWTTGGGGEYAFTKHLSAFVDIIITTSATPRSA
jgi:outer membrane immunogenic protein